MAQLFWTQWTSPPLYGEEKQPAIFGVDFILGLYDFPQRPCKGAQDFLVFYTYVAPRKGLTVGYVRVQLYEFGKKKEKLFFLVLL